MPDNPCTSEYLQQNGWADCVKEYQKTEGIVPCCCAPVGKPTTEGMLDPGFAPGRTVEQMLSYTIMWTFKRVCDKLIEKSGGFDNDGNPVATPPTWTCFSDDDLHQPGTQLFNDFVAGAKSIYGADNVHIFWVEHELCGQSGQPGGEPVQGPSLTQTQCCKQSGISTDTYAQGRTGSKKKCCTPISVSINLGTEKPEWGRFNPPPQVFPPGPPTIRGARPTYSWP
jgi:hypothetical protein